MMLSGIKRLLYRSLSLGPPRSPPPIFVRYTGAKPIQQPDDDGDDDKHWLIQVKEPVGSRDEIIDYYVKLVAQVLGRSEDEARNTIYSVSTKYYFAIGVLVSRDQAYKWKQLPDVINVVADGYVDPVTKDYGGEPFVDGKPVPYDPKYHDFYHRVQARTRAWKSDTTIDDMMKKVENPDVDLENKENNAPGESKSAKKKKKKDKASKEAREQHDQTNGDESGTAKAAASEAAARNAKLAAAKKKNVKRCFVCLM